VCTVIIRVPESPDLPTRVLAIRDEDPERAWQPLGEWWPDDYPGVVGVRDVRAGGAWLAADAPHRRLAVLLNRAAEPLPDGVLPVSRGSLALESVAGRAIVESEPRMGFNLVEVTPHAALVTTWDGERLRHADIPPGTHMIAHDDLDDTATARIVRWHGAFEDASTDARGPDGAWWGPWLDLLAAGGDLDAADERAIIRDNRPLGYPTLSLLLCVASVGLDGVDVRYGEFDRPGHWNDPTLVPPVHPGAS
jgi:hypothetical protein